MQNTPDEKGSTNEQENTITVTKDMDVQGSHFIYKQFTEKSSKELDYDYKRCTGCGLCVNICPTQALELGPMHEIATGMDAPPVTLDIEKCTFCGMCAKFCPVNAFKMETSGEVPPEDSYPEFDSYVKINNKCLPCLLCESSCPEEAIEVKLNIPKKEDIALFDENAEGEIEIDTEKCNLCGLCSHFCDAFIMLEKEPSPTDPSPFEQLMVDEDECDYCMLCQDLCPEDAIKVKGKKPCEPPAIEGEVCIDDDKCTRCGWCREVCPYNAVEIKKPFEGEITLKENNIKRCDPHGCQACFNVCPAHLWYVPEDKNIAIKEDYCIYCGACENACPENVMSVKRTQVHHTKIPDAPWAAQWEDAIESMITSKRKYPDASRTIEVEKEPPKEHEEIEFPEINESLLKAARERIKSTKPALKNINIRRKWEKETSKETRKEVRKKLKNKMESSGK
jgi:4Fe-4S ferredoxin